MALPRCISALSASWTLNTSLAASAAHSPYMDAITDSFQESIQNLSFSKPNIPIVSTLSGREETHFSPLYLTRQLRSPVRFQQAIEYAHKRGLSNFLELGDRAILTPAIRSSLHPNPISTLALNNSWQRHAEVVAALFQSGQNLHWGMLYPNTNTTTPPYKSNKIHLSFPLAQEQSLSSKKDTNNNTFSPQQKQLFQGHQIAGQAIAPAAWMLSKMMSEESALQKIIISKPLYKESTKYRIDKADGYIRLQTQSKQEWNTHISAKRDTLPTVAPFDSTKPCGVHIPTKEIYAALERQNMLYSPEFQTIQKVLRFENTLFVTLKTNPNGRAFETHPIDPRLLDGVFQSIVAFDLEQEQSYFGFSMERFLLYRPIQHSIRATIHKKERPQLLICDILLEDQNGPVAKIEGFCAKPQSNILYKPCKTPIHATPRTDKKYLVTDIKYASELLKAGVPSVFGPIPTSDLQKPHGQLALAQADVLLLSDLAPQKAPELANTLQNWKGEIHLTTNSKGSFALLRSMGGEGFQTAALYSQEEPSIQNILSLESQNFLIQENQTLWQPGLSPINALPQPPKSLSNKHFWILGAGGIACALAQALQHKGAHVVLSGRKNRPNLPFPYIQTDVSNPQQLKETLQTISTKWGTPTSIIHAAGTLQSSMLSKTDPQQIREILQSKSKGLQNLLSLTKDLDLEQIILISSLSSLLPSPGQCIYSAANAYLDAAITQDPRIYVLNYGPWKEVGMVKDHPALQQLEQKGLGALHTQSAVQAFFQAIFGLDRQVAIMATRRTPLIPQKTAIRSKNTPKTSQKPIIRHKVRSTTSQNSTKKAPQKDTKEILSRILHARFGSFDWDTHFSELGIDSLQAIDIIQEIETKLDRRIHPTLMFEYPTPRRLLNNLQEEE